MGANEAVVGVKVMLVAAEDVVANEAVVGVNVIEVAALAVVAKDADTPLKLLICVELLNMPVGILLSPVYDT